MGSPVNQIQNDQLAQGADSSAAPAVAAPASPAAAPTPTVSDHYMVAVPGFGNVAFPFNVGLDEASQAIKSTLNSVVQGGQTFAGRAAEMSGLTGLIQYGQQKQAEDQAAYGDAKAAYDRGDYAGAASALLKHIGKRAAEGVTESPAVQVLRAQGEQFKKALNASTPEEAAGHAVAGLVPLFGPAAAGFAERLGVDVGSKHYRAAAGDVAGVVAPLLLGKTMAGESEVAGKSAAATDHLAEGRERLAAEEPVTAKPAETPAARESTEANHAPESAASQPTDDLAKELAAKELLAGAEKRPEPVQASGKSPAVVKPVEEAEKPNAPMFYSKAERVAMEKLPNAASGDSMLATLRNNGVKEDEVKWLGLDDYLQGKPKVTKADLLQHINDNKIELTEVNKGGPEQPEKMQLQQQRNRAYAENNDLWHQLQGRYGDEMTKVFNALKTGSDIDPIIASLPADVQQQMRRFVETDADLHRLDKALSAYDYAAKPTKYESYTLPGEKENYTEKLLILPDKTKAQIDALNARLEEMANRPAAEHTQHPEWKDEWDAIQKQKNALLAQPEFKSQHFNEPNILAHVRFDDRPAVDGKKTLFLEEVQSDWHQRGKSEGYKGELKPGYRVRELEPGSTAHNSGWRYVVEDQDGVPVRDGFGRTQQEAIDHSTTNRGVPNAPFRSSWHELAIKRMLRYAAENGYERIAWTTGEQQAERYDLSKQISEVAYDPATEYLSAKNQDGDWVINEPVKPNEISDYIGKEPANKLLKEIENYDKRIGYERSEWNTEYNDDPEISGYIIRDPNGEVVRGSDAQPEVFSTKRDADEHIDLMLLRDREASGETLPKLSGLDLKVGGEWAKALYDRAIPNFLNKYAKKWGGKVVETQLSGGNYHIVHDPTYVKEPWHVVEVSPQQRTLGTFKSEDYAKSYLRDLQSNAPKVHSVDITPAMKKSVLKEGQPIAKAERPVWEKGVGEVLG